MSRSEQSRDEQGTREMKMNRTFPLHSVASKDDREYNRRMTSTLVGAPVSKGELLLPPSFLVVDSTHPLFSSLLLRLDHFLSRLFTTSSDNYNSTLLQRTLCQSSTYLEGSSIL